MILPIEQATGLATPFFNTPERIQMLDLEAREWIGTPFAAHARIKHAGADCVGLIAGIYLAVGVLKRYEPGKYALDEGAHGAESKVIAWLTGHPGFREITNGELTPGDVICFQLERMPHHAGLALEHGDFIHALPQRFATVSSLRESFYRRKIRAIFRPVTI